MNQNIFNQNPDTLCKIKLLPIAYFWTGHRLRRHYTKNEVFH